MRAGTRSLNQNIALFSLIGDYAYFVNQLFFFATLCMPVLDSERAVSLDLGTTNKF